MKIYGFSFKENYHLSTFILFLFFFCRNVKFPGFIFPSDNSHSNTMIIITSRADDCARIHNKILTFSFPNLFEGINAFSLRFSEF